MRWTKENLGGTELIFDRTAHAQQGGTVTSHTRKQSDSNRYLGGTEIWTLLANY